MNLDDVVNNLDRETTMILELETLDVEKAAAVLWHMDLASLMVTLGVVDGQLYAEVTAWHDGEKADIVVSDAFGSALVRSAHRM